MAVLETADPLLNPPKRKVLPGHLKHVVDQSLSAVETLENVGLVLHTHLGHGGATYHAAEELTHLHLVCSECESIGDAPIDTAANFVNTLADDYGFKTDVTHFAVYGLCSRCANKSGK